MRQPRGAKAWKVWRTPSTCIQPSRALDPSRRESLFGLCIARSRLIAGGSDARGMGSDRWRQLGAPVSIRRSGT